MTTALEGGEGSASRFGRSLTPGKTRYPLYGRLGGPQGRSGQMQKISPPPGFDPRTFQSLASRYTDYATRPTNELVGTSGTFYKRYSQQPLRMATRNLVCVFSSMREGSLLSPSSQGPNYHVCYTFIFPQCTLS